MATRWQGSFPHNGWVVPAAPNGRVLGWDLAQVAEEQLLLGDAAAIYAVAGAPDQYRPERPPLVLVHGIDGDPVHMQAIVDRLWADRFQLYVLCYDDFKRRTALNGDDFADELRALPLPAEGAVLTIVAHSMGGVVARRALNQLCAGRDAGVERFSQVLLYAADSPWHGYPGPGDRGVEGAFFNLIRPVFPDGLQDMRALSAMFHGDAGSTDPAARPPLNQVPLGDRVSIDVVFAQQGNEVLDYTEGVLARLPALLVEHYVRRCSLQRADLDPRITNFWNGLIAARAFSAFEAAISDRADSNALDEAGALALLEQHYPRFPGDHVGVIHEQVTAPPARSFLDYLCAALAR